MLKIIKLNGKQLVQIIKIMDISYWEQADSVLFYKQCLEKAQFELNN